MNVFVIYILYYHLKSENKVFYSLRLPMSKLQQLLNKHKDKLRDWRYNKIEADMQQTWTIFIDVFNTFSSSYSLSDLLFSTTFLSLLEWKEDWNCYQELFCTWEQSWYITWYKYHKINLALLTTDQERVGYIEENTI